MAATESITEINSEIAAAANANQQQQQHQQQQLSSPQRPTTLFTKFNNDTAIASSSPDSSRLSPMLAATVSGSGSNTTAATAAAAALSPNSSTSSITSPSAFPPEMPQWKKDLIQRRKTNVARTISASGASPASSTSSSLAGDHIADVLHTPTTPSKGAKQIASQYDTLTATATAATVAATVTGRTADQKMTKNLNTKKMPATLNSPIKSPTSSSSSSSSSLDYAAGGHYTPQVELKLDMNAATTATTPTGIVGMPIEAKEPKTPSIANTVVAPIPKQRSTTATTLSNGATVKCINNTGTESNERATTRLAGFEAATAESATSPLQRAVEVFETQETEAARKHPSTSSSSSLSPLPLPSTLLSTSASLTSSSSSSPLSSSSAKCGTYAAVNRQSHSKFDSERSLSSVVTAAPCIGKINSNNSIINNNNCSGGGVVASFNDGTSPSSSSTTKTTTAIGHHNTTAVCDSEKTVINSTPIGVGSGGVCGKISSKLKENQFIKNQVKYQQQKSLEIITTPTGITSPTTTTPYFLLSPSNSVHSASSSSSSPNKLANCNINNTTTKKKMVAVQEIKKSTATLQQQQQSNATAGQRQRLQQRNSSSSNNDDTANSTANNNTAAKIVDFDPSEDLSYGPGIVSKLRCRYLSLALRESMEKQRHCLDNLRRATSLNNLLDRNDDDDDEEEDDEEDVDDVEETLKAAVALNDADKPDKTAAAAAIVSGGGGILKRTTQFSHTAPQQQQQNQSIIAQKTAIYQKHSASQHSNGQATGVKIQQINAQNGQNGQNGNSNNDKSTTENGVSLRHGSRHLKRGNDSLKRARSVEALLCERTPWNFAMNRTSLQTSGVGGGVTIEDKIYNARERLIIGSDIMPPRRLTSIIDDTERPPPDLVKETLKKFEATANRRGRGGQRAGAAGGEVANKVANYKSIIKDQKPNIIFPKPPTSPSKKQNSPIKKPAVKSADLLSSPVGRKTTTAAASLEEKQQLLASTPKARERVNNNANANGNGADNLALRSNNKLLSEQQKYVTDSPVTALTKKLEKLCIENEKQSMKHGKQESGNNSQVPTTPTSTKSTKTDVQGATTQADSNNVYKKHVVGGGGAGIINKSIGESGNVNVNSKTTTTHTTTKQNAHESSQHDKNTENLRRTNQQQRRRRRQASDENDEIESVGEEGEVENYHDNDKEKDDVDDVVVVDHVHHHHHQHQTQQQALGIGTAGSSSDQSDDDEYGRVPAVATTKRVTKTALENIAKAGTTQQFKFAGDNKTTTGTTINNSISNKQQQQILNGNKSNVVGGEITTTTQQTQNSPHELATNSMLNLRATATTTGGKQIGVIRPLLTTTTPPSHHHHLQSNNQHHQHQQQLTSREIEKNRINEMKKTAANATNITTTQQQTALATGSPIVGGGAASATAGTSLDTVINTNSNNSLNKLANTSSSTLTASSSPAASAAGAMATSSPIVSGGGDASSAASGISELDATNSPLWALRKKRQTPPVASAENTTMVFNFRDREKVPDYIENDGVIFRRKRVLPKPNESGFVRLPDLSLETSTDSDYDDFVMCPPSPCDVQFENANIVIDGKSSIRQKPKEATFRVQFNDTLTSTFEYPSEASLIVEDSFDEDHYANTNDLASAYENLLLRHIDSATTSPAHQYHHHVAVDEIIPLPTTTTSTTNASATSPNSTTTPTKNVLGNLPLGSAPLGYYTPVKAPIDNLFQLGVTRAPQNGTSNGPATATTTSTNKSNGNNSFLAAGSSIVGIRDGLSGNDDAANVLDNSDEPESLQYIKPANDELTIAYSEGTQKTDLLY